MKQALRLLAPYLAILVFWCLLSNAWLAILAYHAQVVFWARKLPRDLWRLSHKRVAVLALPSALAGPVLYLLLPLMTHTDLSFWLAEHRLSRVSLLGMIPYFGFVHPLLEQIHWAPLRERTPLSHLLYAGYHIIVLYWLVTLPWLIFSFFIFVTASIMWHQMAGRSKGLFVSVASHVLADVGIVVAAWVRT